MRTLCLSKRLVVFLVCIFLVILSTIYLSQYVQYNKNIRNSRASEVASKNRIIGGIQVTNPNKYPFFVSVVTILKEGAGLCGGVLISPTQVLSAYHCLLQDDATESKIDDIRVFTNIVEKKTTMQYAVKKVTPYQSGTKTKITYKNRIIFPNTIEMYFYDIVILEIDGSISLDKYPSVIKPGSYIPSDASVLGVGNTWQTSREEVGPSDINNLTLNEATVTLESPPGFFLPDKIFGLEAKDMFYYSRYNQTKTSIGNGDSGGPVIFTSENGTYIVAVILGGSTNSQGPSGALYLKASYFENWVSQILNKDNGER